MTKLFVCDICGNPFDMEQPRVELRVAEGFAPNLGEGDYDICSPACIKDFASQYASADQGEEETRKISVQTLTEPVDEELVEVDVPSTGVFFPDGMRVDGKDAEHMPKPTVRRVVRGTGR